MRRSSAGLALLLAVAAAGCEDITNPAEELGTFEDPFVRFEFSQGLGAPESTVRAIFVMTTRVEEDVEVTFSFGGDAVFGADYVIVDETGAPRTDVTAAGGTATIPFNADQTTFPRDTLFIQIPLTAGDGRELEVVITGAETESGRPIETGFIERYREFHMTIEGFVDIPTGAWVGSRISGDVGDAAAQVTIAKPGTPVEVDGANFLFTISDYTGDGSLFGVPVPWAFSVTSGGNVVAAPHSHAAGAEGVTSDVIGTYDFDTQTLTLDVLLTCCGGEGLGWVLELTPQ